MEVGADAGDEAVGDGLQLADDEVAVLLDLARELGTSLLAELARSLVRRKSGKEIVQ